ncbi:hypothetical protein BD770DRAFT_377606 [Pilaira anomala]|nr:hypothetical protein BD770DRAFT_377606 [Pilaira anomala]
MSKWNELPAEVLITIFKHLDPSDNFIQYQLTCKSWRLPAQKIGVKYVQLKGPDQLEKFIKLLADTSLGPTIEKINFRFNPKQSEPLQKIANLCPNLTELGTTAFLPEILFDVLKKERARGNFSKLASLCPDIDACSTQEYALACLSIRDTLKELTITEEILDEAPPYRKNLSFFPNLEMVEYVCKESNNLYEIDQYLKGCSDKLRSVVVYLPDYPVPEWEPNTEHDILSYPNIKKLSVLNFVGTSKIFAYLMEVFPNLDEFDMKYDFSINNRFEDDPIFDKMGIVACANFLQHVTQMSLFNVSYIPIKDPLAVIKKLHDTSGNIKNLKINIQECFNGYKPNMRVQNIQRKRVMNLLPITISANETIFTLSGNPKNPFASIGFIEKSGKGLESLELDMSGYSKCNANSLIRNTSNRDYHLSNILKNCPSLKDLHINSTVLCKFGSRSPPRQKYQFSKSLEFSYSLFDPTFLSSLSLHISYIHAFKVCSCEIADNKNPAILTIDMPYTRFDSIEYTGSTIPFGGKTFLKVESVEDKKISYYLDSTKIDHYSCREYGYVPPDVHFGTSTESEYAASLSMDKCLSVFIKCQNFNLIKLGDDARSLIIEKENH